VFPESDRDVVIAVEEAVHSNCPAHVHAEIHWLGRDDMKRFDRLDRYWRKRRGRGRSVPSAMADAGARALIEFLHGRPRKRRR
jgi:ribosomal protein L32E